MSVAHLCVPPAAQHIFRMQILARWLCDGPRAWPSASEGHKDRPDRGADIASVDGGLIRTSLSGCLVGSIRWDNVAGT
jgi:hypothetical protein